MANTLDQAFITQYNSDLVYRYNEAGFRYRGLTREGTVMGDTVVWQRVSGLAAQAINADFVEHTFQDLDHDNVSAVMVDSVVPTYTKKLDLLKININERQAHARRHLEAMGTKFDTDVRAAILAGADAVGGGGEIGPGSAVALTATHMVNVLTAFNEAKAPDDGGRFVAVSPKTWGRMILLDQFSNADYITGEGLAPFGGRSVTAKMWGGVTWFMDPDIPVVATVAENYAWHRDAVGHGINAQPETTITYENTRSAYAFVTTMAHGVKAVEEAGCFTWSVDEDGA